MSLYQGAGRRALGRPECRVTLAGPFCPLPIPKQRIRVAEHPLEVYLLFAVGTRLLLSYDAPATDAELVESEHHRSREMVGSRDGTQPHAVIKVPHTSSRGRFEPWLPPLQLYNLGHSPSLGPCFLPCEVRTTISSLRGGFGAKQRIHSTEREPSKHMTNAGNAIQEDWLRKASGSRTPLPVSEPASGQRAQLQAPGAINCLRESGSQLRERGRETSFHSWVSDSLAESITQTSALSGLSRT